jgi:hypothetical protein
VKLMSIKEDLEKLSDTTLFKMKLDSIQNIEIANSNIIMIKANRGNDREKIKLINEIFDERRVLSNG